MRFLVTGGAGFIGSNMVERLLNDGERVRVLDNFSAGKREFLASFERNPNLEIVEGDILNAETIDNAVRGCDIVIHFAANPDVRSSPDQTDRDLTQGVVGTHKVLDAMRKAGVKKIAYSSTSTVYGEADELPTPETYGPLFPISLYASSKLGAEAFITAYCHTFDMQCWLFRFANIIGKNGTHGVLVDFIEKLKRNPEELEILGDGKQSKSYLLVEECVDAILFAIEHSQDRCNVFNIGCGDFVNVTRIAEIVVEELGLENVSYRYTGGTRGWKGDVPKTFLSVEKLAGIGWKANGNSENAIRSSVRLLKSERWP